MKYFIFLIILILPLFSCKRSSKSDEEVPISKIDTIERPPQPEPPIKKTDEVISIPFTTNIGGLRLRKEPGKESDVLLGLPENTELTYAGEVTSATEKITLRGVPFDEPWVKVKTKRGVEGWVYGGALNFVWDPTSEVSALLMNRRLETIFGESLLKQIEHYRERFTEAKTSHSVLGVYKENRQLDIPLNAQFRPKIDASGLSDFPDFYWLSQALPGFKAQFDKSTMKYSLVVDTLAWKELAAKTEGGEDDYIIEK